MKSDEGTLRLFIHLLGETGLIPDSTERFTQRGPRWLLSQPVSTTLAAPITFLDYVAVERGMG
jgi:hypothetical protein